MELWSRYNGIIKKVVRDHRNGHEAVALTVNSNYADGEFKKRDVVDLIEAGLLEKNFEGSVPVATLNKTTLFVSITPAGWDHISKL